MAIDPAANQAFQDAATALFAPGSSVWVKGIQFQIISSSGNTLILKPVTAKIS